MLCQCLNTILFNRPVLFTGKPLWGFARGKHYFKWLRQKTATFKCIRTCFFCSLPGAVSGILCDDISSAVSGGGLDLLSRVNLRLFAKFPVGAPAKAAPGCKHSCTNIPAGTCMGKCWQGDHKISLGTLKGQVIFFLPACRKELWVFSKWDWSWLTACSLLQCAGTYWHHPALLTPCLLVVHCELDCQ